MESAGDREFMLEALALAARGWGRTNPNPMVGAVIVRDGRIIGRGFHQKAGGPHAEVNAINDLRSRGESAENATIYVTLEPCCTSGRTPPCTEAVIAAGIRRVVIGALDPNPQHNGRAVEIFRAHHIEIEHGVEAERCRELNRPFFCWITTGKPLVMLKMAMTLDGQIATLSGDSKWVTTPAARSRVQQLRQLCDAILVGAETVRNDHPELVVREPAEWWRQPRRFVASSTFTQGELNRCFPGGNAEIVNLPTPDAWESWLRQLGEQKMTALLIEGGGRLAGEALRAGIVDYVEFHIAPKLLGGCGRPVIAGAGCEMMKQAMALKNVSFKQYGDDFAVCGYLKD